ncbi:MAG: mechanosensitive ion channel [Spirochaetales bacterium]|jgi:small-conductance mechanosensitive channel|nr:mechanosensitive ion channel [Spirochaetales bacterium]
MKRFALILLLIPVILGASIAAQTPDAAPAAPGEEPSAPALPPSPDSPEAAKPESQGGGFFSFLLPREAEQETKAPVSPPVAPGLESEIEETVSTRTASTSLLIRIFAALVIVLVMILLVRLFWYILGSFEKKLHVYGETHFKALKIKKVNLLSKNQFLKFITVGINVLRYVIAILLFYITIPIVFSLFALTRNLASTLFGYILNPLKRILLGFLSYIPNLITIIVILFVAKYVLKTIKFLADQIEHGKLQISGFYADWARPTYQIIRLILYIFVLTVVYPYLPGSDSAIFQGVSVFAGILLSLGSTAAIGNMVAGLVITYMRPFKIGDLVKVGEWTGFVVERTAIVTRIRTFKNEYVTYPNLTILNSNTINYKTSAEHHEGLVLHVSMTMGYSVPWETVYKVLLEAAALVKDIEKTPPPFINQLGLEDFYARYELNAFTKNVDRQPRIYSELYENIQNGFKQEGVDLTAPHFQIHIPQGFETFPETPPPSGAGGKKNSKKTSQGDKKEGE